MSTDVFPKKNYRVGPLVFGLVFLLALGWALVTSHVWEDYYITYRSSKNLATGHGLVFNHGERLHTLIENHARYTGSIRARDILANWPEMMPKFRKVMPVEYRQALAEMAKAQAEVEPLAAAGE